MRPVGHVRVVAGVLDDDGLGPGTVLPHLAPFDGEADAPLFALAGELYVYLLLRLPSRRPRPGPRPPPPRTVRRGSGRAALRPCGEALCLPLPALGRLPAPSRRPWR